ncbi:MAG: hypothetical protein JO305_05130 [Alphaproteobacteria bacterium]|nr:hypothetical protein [Alphaproteobacteria bacterium]
MTPQSNFMVAVPVLPEREPELRALLATMNLRPGVVDPENALFPFGHFDALHVARFVILRDETAADLPEGDSLRQAPAWLAFLGDCDGDSDALLTRFAAIAGDGLRRIFSHCAEYAGDADLPGWLRAHSVSPAACYVNWIGRTVPQIREEAALHQALKACLARESGFPAGEAPLTVRDRLIAYQRENGPALTPLSPTPPKWRRRELLNRFGVPLALVLLAPLVLLYAPLFFWLLRRRETTDPVITPPPTPAHVDALSRIEDHDVTNQFSAFGSLKPGWFRLSTIRFIFWVLEFSTRQIYTRGKLARVGTIHFARWVFMDGRRRVFFASNYDGSLDSYMDDFINKAAFGLNLVFSNGMGYPRTRFLLSGGAAIEQQFKNWLRRRQLPTEVWYKAYPGLTAADLARNTMIREGLDAAAMTEDAARRWLALI